MTTDPHDEHGEILRRALHAEADSVNPAGDGLERIRARIAAGESRRSGLGRFGIGRFSADGFGMDRFTVGWARPVLAVATAVLIAGVGVTAPRTMDLIQQSVGSSGPAGGERHDNDGDRAATGGAPQSPGPSSPGGTPSGEPSTAQSPSSTSSPGLSSCRIPPADTPTASPSPGATSTPPRTEPCPGQTPTESATGTPSPKPSPSVTPDRPTEQPEPAPSTEPAKTGEQGASSASP